MMSKMAWVWLVEILYQCYEWNGENRLHGDMKDNGRRFKAKMHQNEAGRYLIDLVLSEYSRRHFAIFPKGFNLLS